MSLPYPFITPPSNGSNDWRLNVSLIPNFLGSLGNVANNTSNCRILFIGDSTTYGTGDGNSTTPRLSAFPAQLANIVKNFTGLRVSNALGSPFFNIVTNTPDVDARFTLTGSFIQRSGAAGFGNCCFSVNAAGTLVFTPGDGLSYDSYRIYTQGTLGGGTISAQVTGGTSTNIVVPNSSNIGATVVTGPASTSNNITLTWVSGNVQVIAVEGFLSTQSQILFGNVGVPGSKTSDWINGTSSLNAIKGFAPNLVVVMLGVNDGQNNISVQTYINNISTILSTTNVGNFVVMSTFPSDPTQQAAYYEGTYANALLSFATANNIPFIDIYNRFGAIHQSSLFNDILHPNFAGYNNTARFLFSNLFL